MAATELATAYLSLVPSMRGAQGAIARELSSVDADGIGRGIGSKMGGGISGGLKGLVGPALAGLAAIGFGGFIAEAARASDATDKFKSTLNFAGLGAPAIEAATKAAKSYADETVYELSDIQKTMATLAANGVKDYTGITTAAGNLNAVAGGNAETFKSVSLALGQSAGAGKLMAEDWNMLADAIPGASGQLQSAMREAGAFEGNFKKAMENGEISADEFQAAISKLGSDPIAVEAARSVTTFEGALGNLSATVNSGLMAGLDALKPMITGAINGVAAGLQVSFDWIGNAVGGLRAIIMEGDFTGALREAFGLEEDSPAVGFLLRTHTVLAEGVPALKDLLINGNFSGAFREAFGVEEDSPAVAALFRIRETVISVMGGIRDFVTGFTIPLDFLDAAGVDTSGLIGVGVQVRALFEGLWAAVQPLIPSFVSLWTSLSPLQLAFQVIQPFLPQLLAMFSQLAAVVGQTLMTAITGILPSIMSLSQLAVQLFQGVLAAVLPTVVQLITMLGTTMATLAPIVMSVVTVVAGLAVQLVSALMPIILQLVSSVLPMVVTSFGAILSAVGPVIQIVAGLLIPIIQALMPVVVTIFGVVVQVITSAMRIVQGIIQVVTGIITGNWRQVFTGLGNIVSGAFQLIMSLIRGGIDIVVSIVRAGLNLVGGFFRSVFNGVTSFLGGVWGNITSGVSGMIGRVTGFFGGLIGKITGAIGNAGGALLQTGKDIIQGLINGISSMMGAIGRAVISIVPEAIRGPFEDLLGIRSPSRVAIYWGHMIGAGLVGGLHDAYGDVQGAVEGLVTAPEVPAFAVQARGIGAASVAYPAATGAENGPGVVQHIHPRANQSEETIAEISARKIMRAGVR